MNRGLLAKARVRIAIRLGVYRGAVQSNGSLLTLFVALEHVGKAHLVKEQLLDFVDPSGKAKGHVLDG